MLSRPEALQDILVVGVGGGGDIDGINAGVGEQFLIIAVVGIQSLLFCPGFCPL